MARIRPAENGPLVAQGIPSLKDAAGADIAPDQPAYGLRRRGHSSNKPFSDGSHYDEKWRDDA